MLAPALPRLYAVSLTLLLVHELDSAFWREWELFGLPGGRTLFLALHVPLIGAALWGYGRALAGARAGAWAGLAVAAGALAAPAIHGAFLAAGRTEFRTGASLVVLAASGVTGAALALVAVQALGTRRPGAARVPSP